MSYAQPQLSYDPTPTRLLGQPNNFTSGANWVEGREFSSPQALALDTTATPPILYVADTGNSRVLAWRDASTFAHGATADKVIGQRDFFATNDNTPRTAWATFNSGLSRPVGLAVDRFGHLWVADTGNNRVLRYKRPFDTSVQQDPSLVLADLAIGQASLAGRAANRGGRADQNTIRTLASNNAPLYVGLQFDGQGNLWVTDSGNNRLLRFPAAAVAEGASDHGPNADLVIGQPDFLSTTAAPNSSAGRADKSRLLSTNALAFDGSGNLYLSDDLNRVLFYRAPLAQGQAAERILGLPPQSATGQAALVSEYAMGGQFLGNVRGVFVIDNQAFVADSGNSRIVRYEPPAQWGTESGALPSPAIKAVLGQENLNSGRPNRGDTFEPSAVSFSSPSYAVATSTELFVTDSGNNRVLVFPNQLTAAPNASGALNLGATRVLGQIGFEFKATNLIEGKEFSAGLEVIGSTLVPFGLGAAVDRGSTPPRLYIADTGNNRILGFADARRVASGARADLVVGQVDFHRDLVNSPGNDPARPTETGLRAPASVAVDAQGNLWVADRGNGRVLRFPRPFDKPAGPHTADLVIGQSTFTTRSTEATARTLGGPSGVAVTVEGNLVVSDTAFNRVLYFPKPLENGMAATIVLGQPNFNSVSSGAGTTQLSLPRHLALDSDDRVYVADFINRRVQIWKRITTQISGAAASAVLNLPSGTQPSGIDISPLTGGIWVADYLGNRVLRWARFDQLLTNPNAVGVLGAPRPLSIRIDAFDNPIVSDAANRVAFHYPSVAVTNSASGFLRVAPGMIATLYLQTAGPQVVSDGVVNSAAVWPRELADLEILFDGRPAPLYYVFPHQLACLVPTALTVGSTVEVVVRRPSTGQVFASTRVRIDIASPAFFTSNQQGTGQIAAINQDGRTINGPNSQALRGEVISLYLTGQGVLPGMPEDGVGATGLVVTPPENGLQVVIGTAVATVQFSGLAPGFSGLWQINAVIPANTAPGTAPVAIQYRGIASNQNPVTGVRISTTISVR